MRGCGEAVVVVLQEECFFSELRVITFITKKYSTLKTTTTTDYHILNLPPPAVPIKEADQFFSQHPIIYRPTHPKNRTPTGGVSPLPTTPFSEIFRRPVHQKNTDMTQIDPKLRSLANPIYALNRSSSGTHIYP